MATHSSILAWEIPWTEEPDGLQSTGSQRVRQYLVTEQQYIYIYVCVQVHTHTHTHTHTQIYTQTHTAELGALLKEHRGQNQSSRGPDRAPAQPHTAARVQAHRSRQVDSAGAGFYR